MLNQIKLTCFMQHEDRTFTFGEGLNAIKGANEAGKSTIILAALYALFGAKVLPLSLAETVTWGRKESELKVSLTLTVDGRLFNFTRGKSGAECAYDGGLVTGQNEVSNFAGEILGADRELMCRLTLANQAKLRGALEEGPKAVSAMIENLADFDLFDRILEAADHKLLTGPTTSAEERIKVALEQVELAVVATPDFREIDAKIDTERSQIAQLEAALGTYESAKVAAESAVSSAQSQKRMRDMLEANLRKAVEQEKLHVEQKKDAEAKAAKTIDEAELAALKEQLRDARAAAERLRVFGLLKTLMASYPEAFWEGAKEDFDLEVERVEGSISENEAKAQAANECRQRHNSTADKLSGQIILSMTCPSCGSELKDRAKIEACNAELEKQISEAAALSAQAKTEQAGFASTVAGMKSELQALKSVAKSSAPFEKFATQYGAFVEVDLNFYPPKLNWRGTEPQGEGLDEEGLRSRIVSQESAKDAAERANARSHALAETLKEDAEYIARLNTQLAEIPEVLNLEELQDASRKASNDLAVVRFGIETAQAKVSELGKERAKAEAEYEFAVKRKDSAEADLKKAQEDLETLNFNNTLLKKIRAARPVVSDRLWSMVLTSVSTMFSTMRGEKSVVAKDKDGFSINGKAVQSFSGSTLDILGLAIRVALARTFIPHVGFTVLDEPAAACDEDRTSTLLGFLASAGFQQVIVVSHEGAAEAAADHLISL